VREEEKKGYQDLRRCKHSGNKEGKWGGLGYSEGGSGNGGGDAFLSSAHDTEPQLVLLLPMVRRYRAVQFGCRACHRAVGCAALWPMLALAALHVPDLVQTRLLFTDAFRAEVGDKKEKEEDWVWRRRAGTSGGGSGARLLFIYLFFFPADFRGFALPPPPPPSSPSTHTPTPSPAPLLLPLPHVTAAAAAACLCYPPAGGCVLFRRAVCCLRDCDDCDRPKPQKLSQRFSRPWTAPSATTFAPQSSRTSHPSTSAAPPPPPPKVLKRLRPPHTPLPRRCRRRRRRPEPRAAAAAAARARGPCLRCG